MVKFKLKDVMKKRNVNIGQLSEMTGLHRNGISKMVNGKSKGIEFPTLDKLCDALECDVTDLIEYVKENKEK